MIIADVSKQEDIISWKLGMIKRNVSIFIVSWNKFNEIYVRMSCWVEAKERAITL